MLLNRADGECGNEQSFDTCWGDPECCMSSSALRARQVKRRDDDVVVTRLSLLQQRVKSVNNRELQSGTRFDELTEAKAETSE